MPSGMPNFSEKEGDFVRATGIVRRIDDLGRVVIPKEVRRSMRMREGDPLEVFIDNGAVIFKKYSVMQGMSEFTQSFVDSLDEATGNQHIINDQYAEKYQEVAKSKGNFTDKPFTQSMPIAIGGEVIGEIIAYSNNEIEKSHILLMKMAAMTLGRLSEG